MIIVSQNKMELINFERVNYIQVSKVDEKKSVIEINHSDSNWKMFAEYKTEKRAKEVLIEIMQSYIDSENYKYMNQLLMKMNVDAEILNRLQKGLVYEMPEE